VITVYFYFQGLNLATKRLEIATTANQDPLLNLVPIIGVDIWEHAFYLQYLNVKVDVSPGRFTARKTNPLTCTI
jgi:hypothetical protein